MSVKPEGRAVPERWAVELRGPDGQRFEFNPGALCLRFAVTGGERERAIFETLHGPDDLASWIDDTLGLETTAVDGAGLRAAKRLREAIWRCAVSRAGEGPLPSGAIEAVNAAAAAPPPVPRVDRLGERSWAEPVVVDQVLSAVARDAIDVLAGPSTARIRRCEGRDCTLIFLDTSRPGRRRWCSMERCGNRAKVRAYRERRQDATPSLGAPGERLAVDER